MAMRPEDAWQAGILWDSSTTLIFTSETAAGGGMPRHTVRRAVSRMCPKPRPAVYALEPVSVGEILSDIKTVGDAVGRQAAARSLIEALRARIDVVSLRSARAIAEGGARRVVCVSGDDPPVAAGTWLAELIGLAGGIDALDGVGRPPRAVTWDQIRAARPDLVFQVGEVSPGPGSVDLLERLAASIVQAPLHQG
jgi:ABC-type Fe3+-hydroxamate transport system substrate-binding protein